jgi:ankyrin repeat protein
VDLLQQVRSNHVFTNCIDLPAFNGRRPIHIATALGDLRMISVLRHFLVDIDTTVDSEYRTELKEHGYTPLHLAIENGDLETVIFLIKMGADVTRRTAGLPRFRKEENPPRSLSCAELAKELGFTVIAEIIARVENLLVNGLDEKTIGQIQLTHMLNGTISPTSFEDLPQKQKIQLVIPEEIPDEERLNFLRFLFQLCK